MTVMFLDFDGVLNSLGSFHYEDRRRRANPSISGPVDETLDPVCVSNVQYVLDHYPEMKVVITSTWRINFDLEWLKDKLASYGMDPSRVIDMTPNYWQERRGEEIKAWLDLNPNVDRFIILDDNDWGISELYSKNFIRSAWHTGFTFDHALDAITTMGDLRREVKNKRRESKANAKPD